MPVENLLTGSGGGKGADPWEGGRLQPVVLEGSSVRLEPLTSAHEPALLAAAQDERIWRFTIHALRTSPRR